MAGRRPLPSKVKAARGTERAGRANVKEPSPKVAAASMAPPAGLGEVASEHWLELVPLLVGMRVLTMADVPALRATCEAWADYRAACDELRKLGSGYYRSESEQGGIMYRAHPALADRNDAWRRYKSGLVEFGLTPAARSKVEKVETSGGGPKRLEDWLQETGG